MPRESQYIDDYLDGPPLTPGSYLNRVLKGKAKHYSGSYYRSLMRAIDARVQAGTVCETKSIRGATAYRRVPNIL